MDVLADQTLPAPLSVKVSTARAELPATEPAGGGLPPSPVQQQAEYWRQTLADAPEPLEVPSDRPRPAQPDHAGAHVRLQLDEQMTAGLRALGSRHGATLSTTLLAGWAAVLGRLSGQTDLVIGTFTRRPEVEDLIGLNPLPVRVDLSGSPTAAELLGRVQARVQGALRNQDLPFQRVVELVQPDGAAASATPLFRAAFAWRDAPGSAELPDLEPRSTAGLDISLELREEGGGVAGEVVFATSLFDRETVERYVGYLRRMLAGMAADDTRPVDRLPLLSDEERHRVVVEWNRTAAPYPTDSYIHELFEAQSARTPDAPAVFYDDQQLTYGELNRRANRLAHHLRALGVGPDVRVGICVERTPAMVVAVFGVLKAGGAYLPLDPGYPQERLLDMVQDSAPVVLLTQASLAGRLAGLDLPLLALDEDAAWWEGQPDTDPSRAALTPESLTYVIYTSGSTGRPKGVMMTHRGASNLLHWYLGSTGISEQDRVLIVTSFSFHLTQRNLMAPLFVGGQVHLAREPFEPQRLTAQIVASGITMMNLTPTGFQALVEADGGKAIGGLRIVVFGGEALYPRQLARVPEPRPTFLNPYGSTEATGITAHHFARADLTSYTGRSMPPGRPIANATIYVLDGAGEPVPVGVTGELYLGGAGVTRGYRSRPGHTAERYLPDPFGTEPGARLYRTGDLGRWLPDGTIEYIGRGDAQVKVRGFRIELGEIEARLAEHEGVHEAVVVARGGEIGDPRLVAYYTGEAARAEALRAHLAERLPEYMIPAAFVFLDALPVNPNGKLDRKALPEPDFASSEDESYVAPRTPVEEVLAGIWAEVLGLERVGVEEGFFDRGGHSLLATRVVSRVRELFGVELPLRALFEGPTVAQMARAVEDERRRELAVLPPVVPVERTRALPLSFAQERLWFLDRLEPGSTFYNLPFALRLRGALDVAALERSLGEIVRRHDALRTVFTEADGSPVQVIAPFASFPLPVKDLSHLPEADRETEVQREFVAEGTEWPFDLSAGPLFRAVLLRLGAQEHVLLLSQHHIVNDGWSMGVLYRELAALYEAYRQGGESPLAELPVQYADFAVWQREQLEGEALDRQLAYWRQALSGAPELLELPTDHPRPAVQTYRGETVPVSFSAELLERLQALGRSEGATLYMTLLGAFQVLLSKYSGSDDIVVGSPIAGRTRKETEELIGFFVNTLVLRTDLSGDPSFREVLRRTRGVTLGAYEHQEVPFERLVAELQPERTLSHSPLFQVLFTLQTAGGAGAALPGLDVSRVESERASAKFDLSLVLTPTPRGLRGGVTYSTDLFDRATIDRMLGHLQRVLEQVAANADVRLSRLALAGPQERAQVVVEWNRTGRPFPREACIHQIFEAQAARTPDTVALVWGAEEMTYRELDARANQLAHHLAALGVGPESRVGLRLERTLENVIATLGVLKAGGCCVPVDTSYPAERMELMLADSGARVLLSRSELVPAEMGRSLHVVCLDQVAQAVSECPAHPPRNGAAAQNLAYVFYTSGSTGRPKGVMMAHREVVQLACVIEYMRMEPGDRVAQASNVSFDAAVFEIWGALLNGATLVGIDRDVLLSAPALSRTLREQRITTLYQTAALFNQHVREQVDVYASLRQLVFGAEAVGTESVRRMLRSGRPGHVLHEYGPTEATVWCTLEDVQEVAEDAPTVLIGRPIPNARAYVLDPAGQPLPVGVPGELCIGGEGVVRGYLGRGALTAERFVPDPFSEEPGARMYRTGDRVRWRAEGKLEFMGRLDDQVKIRGFRIEPGEVEAAMAAYPGVRHARVMMREDQPGDKRLVAYVVGGVEVDGLRAHLRQGLPEYMVPQAIVLLDRLPLNPNGKVDRKALPVPEYAADADRYVAPRTPVEEVLAGIWAEVLRLDRAGVEESFFELGGHSLLATRVVARIRAVFQVELPLRALFEGPTVAELAGRVEELRRAELPVLPPVVPAARTGTLPLSFAQERLWFIDRLEPGSAVYNMPVAWRLAGTLDGAALERALGEIVRRHDALRTVFAEANGAPVQVVAPFAGFALPVEDLSHLPQADREAEVRRRAVEEARRAFDLSAGPLFRAALLRLGGQEHALLLTVHHIVSDGWSMGVLYGELSALYEAYRAGGESPLPELPVQYADYAVWQRQQVEGAVLDGQMAYWRERLAGAPELLELPTDHPRPPVQTYRGAHEQIELSAELLERLQALARGEGATLYMTVLGAFQVLLAKYSGTDDIVVGSPIAGRTRKEVEELIGFFVNTVVLRTDLGGDPGFREVLRRVREVTLGAYEHQEMPFERLVAELQPERSLSHSPLFQVMFAQRNAVSRAGALAGVEVSDLGAELAHAKFDLFLTFKATAGGLNVGLTYSTDLFERATVERMLGHLARVLEQVTADADVRLSRLQLLGEPERALVLEEWNRTEAEFPADRCIHELFQAQAARTPDAVALRFEEQSLTYRELNERANRLAHHLIRRGVGPEVRVGICQERSLEMVVSILAVLKAGGAYVPLDPGYPADRLAYVLDDSAVPLVLVQAALAESIPAREGVAVLAVDALAERLAAEPAEDPAGGAGPDSLAYVIYTSGSTGRPKGVMNAHRGVVNRLVWMQAHFGLGADDVVLQKTPFGFDVSVWEFFWPLQQGARLVVARPDGHRDPAYLRDVVEREGVTTLHFVPSMLQPFVEAVQAGRCASLRHVVCSGEALPPALVRRFYDRFAGPVVLTNLYGPTEAAVDVSCWTCPREGSAGVVPIGRPVWNTALYVLDAALRPVPVGTPGELYIGGVQVARGYLGRPALTAERFVPDPFSANGGARLYRTGDRARWRADGAIEYLGRLDFQVKVRGFRIELGEIEAALGQAPGVADCAVVAREDPTGDRRLVAYVVGTVEADALREGLRRTLPEYMVPSAFVFLDALPVSPNGKLDRKALPAPELASAEDRYVAPRTPTDEVLAGIWAEVLRLERVGVAESFFDLGGHSLLATRVMSRIREMFGVELPLRALFEGPTVAQMAKVVEDERRRELPVLPPVVPVEHTGALPLSFAQERLWLVDQVEGAGALYNVPVARRLEGALDVDALRGALGEIVRRHEALRTVFAEVDGSPRQVIVPFAGFEVPVEDLSALDEAERQAAVGERAEEDAARPFDLSAGPLVRARLLRLGQEEHVLLLCLHHVVSDGWSMDVLAHELNVLYDAFREKRPSPLPEPAVQYADYAVWQRGQLEGQALDRQLAYWRQALSGAPELLELPADHPRPATRTHGGAHERIDLPAALLERLRALGRDEGATLFMVLLGAFQALLSRYGAGDDVVVGTPIAGRTSREIEGLIGYFSNTLVLRTDLGGDPAFRDVLRRVREATLGADEHQDVPFDRLVAELRPERSLSHTPLFQATFTLRDGELSRWSLPGLQVSAVRTETHLAKFDLMLAMEATPGGLRAGLTYATDLFERDTIRRMLGHLERVLEQVAADADVRLSGLRLAGEVEWALMAAGQATRSFPVAERLDQRFEARALERPDAPALTFQGETLTYGELNERANRLAHRLRALGVGPETRVGIVLERSAGLVAAILAVLKAGGAYVPLDPAYPAERIAFVLEDADIPVLVTTSGLLARLSAFAGAALCVDTDADAIARESGENPGVQAAPDTLAYVIYTSGSTGKPKGVQVTHANVARLFDATEAWFGFGTDDVWTLFHSCAFDFSVWEIWGALLYGGRLVVVPYLVTRSPEDFHRLLADEGVTMLSQTPSAFKQLVQADLASGIDPSALRLRCVVFGGEALDPQSLRPWMERHGDARPRLVNMYGITETTVHVTYRVITRADLDRAGSPIGVPIPDLSLYVLDAGLQPVPPGVAGELFVGGAGVARGYLNRPELTAQRFIQDPFSADPAARLYRTGDLARRRADGELEYLGRADQQVKIRGFRIELGEIEAALTELPGIRDAAVLVRDEAGREKQLVAYVVLHPGTEEDPAAMRAALAVRLPEHMVPAVFVVLAQMPLTSHGKLDRRALPAPEAGRTLRPAYASPASAAEALLQEVWQEVLDADQVGVLENFFAAGGDSIRAVQMVAVLRRRGMALTVRDLFEAPTIRGLADRVDTAAGAGQADGSVPHHLADLPEAEWARVRAVFPAPIQDVYRATGMQTVMLSAYAKDTARTGVYHPQQCHRLTDDALSVDALRQAIEQVVRRHAVLRTVFTPAGDGTLLQVVRESPCVPIGYHDLRGLSPDEQERAVQAGLARDLDTPFDPGDPHGSLMRFVIFHRDDHVADLLISAHHAVEDGWGNVHFVNTLFQAYADVRDGRPVSAAPLPNTYREFVALEAEILASDEARTFWRDRMRQVDSPWPAPRGGTGAPPRECRVVRQAAPELAAALRETASREGIALKALYLSAFLDVVARLSGGEDACAGVVWNGRSERLSDPLTALGLFWNLLPVARPATASDDAAERALAVHQDLLQADLFGRYPLAEIMADRGGREPFFSSFNFLDFRNRAGRDAVRGGRVKQVYSLDRLHLPFNLAVSIPPRGEGARLRVEYDGRFFSQAEVADALESYLLRLEELTSAAVGSR